MEIEPPARTPTRLARIKADADPRKTAKGFFDLPLRVRVANCVLSPNSAINIVMKEDINKLIIISVMNIKNSITNPCTHQCH